MLHYESIEASFTLDPTETDKVPNDDSTGFNPTIWTMHHHYDQYRKYVPYSAVDIVSPGSNGALSKTKRGLSGFANGSRISAFPDTGSTRNVVSEAFVRELKLEVKGSPCEFKLGNSQQAKSIGELLLVFVKVVWWLTDSSRHSELQLGIFRMRYRCYEHRLRCPTYM